MRRPPRTAYLFRSGLSLCKRSRDPPGHTDGLSPSDSPTGLVLPPTRGTWRSPGANARRRCSCQLPIGGFWRSLQQEVADQFDRLHERKSFAGSVVELLGDPVQVFAAVHAQVGALGEVLAQQG